MRKLLVFLISFLAPVTSLFAACTSTKQNADYSEMGSGNSITLTTGSGHTSAINAVGDLIVFSVWCYQTCTPGTLTMGSQTAVRTTVSGDHTSDGGSLFTGQGFLYYIQSSTQSGNQTITWNMTGATQTQIAYMDFTPSAGCTFTHHIDSALGSSSGGGTTANQPTISGIQGDLLVNFVYTTQHVNPSSTAPWACPVYAGSGETQTCTFVTTVNGQAYTLAAASSSQTTNWGIINTSTAWESLITSFTPSGGANSCPASVPSGVTICHYVAASGLDTNTGADEAHPWAHVPGMPNCVSSCAITPTAGHGFIFRGGDTWHFGAATVPATGGTWDWGSGGWSGTSSNPIYIGVDQTWFSGASWVRPIFNGDNPTSTSPVASCAHQIGASNNLTRFSGASFVILDNFEMTGLCQNSTNAPFANDLYINETGGASNTYENLYIHGWTALSFAGCSGSTGHCFNMFAFLGTNSDPGDLHFQDVVDGSDSNPGSLGVMFQGGYNIAQCVFRFTSQIVTTKGHILRDTLFDHWYEPGDGQAHGNLYEESFSSSSTTHAYYNNVFSNICVDSGSCPLGIVGIWPQPGTSTTDYFFGNLIYNANLSGNYFNIGQNSGAQGPLVIFNNTFEATDNGFIFQCNATATHLFTDANNHFITNSASPYSSPCTGRTTVTSLLQSHATANGQGYTNAEAFAFSPANSSGSTVNNGTNEQSFCNSLSTAAGSDSTLSNAAAACLSDTRYACTYSSSTHAVTCPARTVVARGAAWDQGAYEFAAGGPVAPTVTTTTATSITTTTASSGGSVTSNGGASVTSEGVCYATTANPTSPCTSNGTATPFTSAISGLTTGTLYHYRAFATNSAGTGFGSDLTFTTLSLPTVTTTVATSITTTSASSGGTVTNNGGASITSEGVCYATTLNPTTPCTSDGIATPFTSAISGLNPSTLYHYRAFATNSVGTSFGSDLTFTTVTAATVATPVFTPIPGGYAPTSSTNQSSGLPSFPWATTGSVPVVTIMDNTPFAVLCVTTDGTTPTTSSPGVCTVNSSITSYAPGTYPTTSGFTQYQVPESSIAAVTVTSNTTIKALATEAGFTNSPVVTNTYVIDAACVQTANNLEGGQPGFIPYLETAGTASWASGTTTVTLNFTTHIAVGENFTVVGAVPGAFNGNFTISAVSGNQISYLQATNPGQITTGGFFYGLSGLDGTNGIGSADGLAYLKIFYQTSLPTNAMAEVGGDRNSRPFLFSPLQDISGATSHFIVVQGIIPGPTSTSFGIVSYPVVQSGPNIGVVCGSASRMKFAPNYTGGAGAKLTPPSPTSTTAAKYKIDAFGNHHVTAGYSGYITLDLTNLANLTPASHSLTIALTGEPTTGTQFNWMGSNTKTTSTGCTNNAIDSSSIGDTLTQSSGGVCNDTNSISNFGNKEIQFVTSASTPPGTYTLVITMTGNGTTNTINWPLIVDPANAPFGVTSAILPHAAPTSYPTIPNQAPYVNAVSAFGQQYWICAQDNGSSPTIQLRVNNNSNLTGVGFATTNASWFYDGVEAWFGADSLLANWGGEAIAAAGTHLQWSQCRENVAELYRDKTVLGVVVPTILEASRGFYQDYLNGGGLGGQALDKQEVTQMTTLPQSPYISTAGSYNSLTNLREIAYTESGYIHAVAMNLDQPVSITSIPANVSAGNITVQSTLFASMPPAYFNVNRSQEILISGGPAFYNGLHNVLNFTATTFTYSAAVNGPGCSGAACGTASIFPVTSIWTNSSTGATVTPMAAFMDYNKDHIISQMEQACVTQDLSFSWEEFMLGLSMRNLVEYYNVINPGSPDPRIPAILKSCADFLYSDWQKENVGNWHYVTESAFGNNNITTQGQPTGTTCTNEEYSEIIPIYAWLYQYSGLPIYQQEGDYAFGLNATFTTGNGSTSNTGGQAQIPGGCYKTANQTGAFAIGSGSTGKVFSQHYFWGNLNYVAQRNPIFNVFPGSVGVYNQTQGTTSTPQIITLSNPANPTTPASSLSLGARTITGTDASRFAISGSSCGATIAVGATCTVSVTFTPTAGANAIVAYGGLPTTPNTFLNIPVGSNTYKIPLYGVGVKGVTATPTATPNEGTYTGTQNIVFSSSTPGATICYSVTGNTPAGSGNETGGGGVCRNGTTLANGGTVPRSSNTTFFRTEATAPGYADAIRMTELSYTITAGTTAPTFSPFAGSYSTPQSVTISSTNSPSPVICYTTDGSNPTTNGAGTCTTTNPSTIVYSGPVAVNVSETLTAISTQSGFVDSPIASSIYDIGSVLDPPTFSPPGGPYTSGQNVTINDTDLTATICYTTDNSTPTADGNGNCINGTTYSTAVTVSSSLVLKAIASDSGNVDSGVGSATYIIGQSVANIFFSPAAGPYTTAQSITMSSTTTGAVLCYTTNNTTPTTNGAGVCTLSNPATLTYSSPVSVSVSETLTVVGTASGYFNSATNTASYIIGQTASSPVFNPVAGTYTSAQTVTITDLTPGSTICYTNDGTTPTADGNGNCVHGFRYTSSIPVSSTITLTAIGDAQGYLDSAPVVAVYTIASNPSVHSPARTVFMHP